MRGGAIPVLSWATLLVVLYIGNWIWDEKQVNPFVAAFAVVVIFAWGLLLWLRCRQAIEPGPPPPERGPEAEPDASVAAMLIGLSIAAILFGIVWATFLIYFGAGLLLLSLGRLALELRAERATRERAAGGAGR